MCAPSVIGLLLGEGRGERRSGIRRAGSRESRPRRPAARPTRPARSAGPRGRRPGAASSSSTPSFTTSSSAVPPVTCSVIVQDVALAVPQDVRHRLARDPAEGRLRLSGSVGAGVLAVHGAGDARRRAAPSGPRRVRRPRSVLRCPRTTSRTSRSESSARRRISATSSAASGRAAADELTGQLALHRDRREVAAHHVVQVPGEPQALLGDGQLRLHPAVRSISRTRSSTHTEKRNDDGESDDDQRRTSPPARGRRTAADRPRARRSRRAPRRRHRPGPAWRVRHLVEQATSSVPSGSVTLHATATLAAACNASTPTIAVASAVPQPRASSRRGSGRSRGSAPIPLRTSSTPSTATTHVPRTYDPSSAGESVAADPSPSAVRQRAEAECGVERPPRVELEALGVRAAPPPPRDGRHGAHAAVPTAWTRFPFTALAISRSPARRPAEDQAGEHRACDQPAGEHGQRQRRCGPGAGACRPPCPSQV